MEKSKSPWIRWSEQKPNEGQMIVAVTIDKKLLGTEDRPTYNVVRIGAAVLSILKELAKKDEVFWIEMPK